MILGLMMCSTKSLGMIMSEKIVKEYFAAMLQHTKNKDYILNTMSWFKSDDELKEVIMILNESKKMSVSEIELTIIERIVEKRNRREKWQKKE